MPSFEQRHEPRDQELEVEKEKETGMPVEKIDAMAEVAHVVAGARGEEDLQAASAAMNHWAERGEERPAQTPLRLRQRTPETRSPTAMSVTCAPIAATTPAYSWPVTIGTGMVFCDHSSQL